MTPSPTIELIKLVVPTARGRLCANGRDTAEKSVQISKSQLGSKEMTMGFAPKLGQRSMKASNRKMTKQDSRQGLRRWLKAVIAGTENAPDPSTRLLLEPLEQRQLMAGDVDLNPVDIVPLSNYGEAADISASTAQGEPQGESAPDLVAFAKALKDAGVRFFGAIWCPFCNEQKALFGDGAQYLPFEEVTNPDRSLNALGVAEDIKTFPTWEFQNGTRETAF